MPNLLSVVVELKEYELLNMLLVADEITEGSLDKLGKLGLDFLHYWLFE